MTTILLAVLILLTLARLIQSARQHAETSARLDFLSETLTDYLKAILTDIRKKKP